MATSGYAVGVYSGRTSNDLILNVSRHSVSGNSSRWSWTLTARKFGSTSYVLDAKPWAVNVEGNTWSGNHNLDFRNTSSITIASGTTGWIAHDSNGYNTVTFSASHSNVGLFGTASLSGSFAADRIPKVPEAPTPIGIDQVTADSLRYRFSGNGNGGATISSWQIQLATNSGFTSGVKTYTSNGTTTITGLSNHTQYWVRARGQNSVGWGPYSASRTDSTLGHPTAPRSVVATPSSTVSGRIGITWTAPATTGEGGITGYNIFRDGTQIATTTGTGTGYTDSGRTPYESYSYTVSARNAWSATAGGTGPKSAASDAVAPGPPSAPRNLTGVSDVGIPGRVNLSWTAPVNIGAGGITGYTIRYANGTLIANTTGTGTTYAVSNLTPGVAYTFKVSARNALADAEGSESAFSNQVVVTPIGEPQAPTNVTAVVSTNTSNRITVSWTPPSGALSGFSIFRRVSGADTLLGKVSTNHTSFAVDDLASGQSHTFVVRARTVYTDTLGDGYPGNWGGPASSPVSATATSNSVQAVPNLSAASSATNLIYNGTYTISAITASTIRYAKTAANIAAASSGGSIVNNTNEIFNGTYTIGIPAPNVITYSKTNPNIASLPTSGGLVSNLTNISMTGTKVITAVNAGANLISYSAPGANFASRDVPVNNPPGQSSTIVNLSNAIFNGTGRIITAVTDVTLSYAQTNANVTESNAAGTVTNVTNRDVFNGRYTITAIPEYNVVQYARTAANIALRTWFEPNGLINRTISPSTLDIRFRSGWSG